MSASPAGAARRTLAFGDVTVTSSEPLHGAIVLPADVRAGTVRLHFVHAGALAHRGGTGGDRRTRVLRAGSAFTTVDPHRAELLAIDGCRVISVTLPAAVLRDVPLTADGIGVVPPGAPLLAPTTAFVAEVARTSDDVTGFSGYFVERLLQEMALGLLVDSLRLTRVPRAPETFTVALSLITAQRSDPDLRPEGVAREVRLSLRQLERVFREHDTTIGREIRRARVDHAVMLLTDESYAALTVDQVARFAGFSNGSSLSRAMAALGMASPRRVRESPPVTIPRSP